MPVNSPTLLGNRLPQSIPQPQQVDSNSWLQVSATNNFVAGIRSNNLLYAWGTNNNYQVGDGTSITKSAPTQISSSSFLLVSAGFDHSVAITPDNKLYIWGNQPSIMSLTTTSSWTLLSTSGNHTLAIRNDGTLWTWGLNNAGQLGDNSTFNKSSPVQIGTGTWIDVSVGQSHSLAISSTGQLYLWGHNNVGQVGDATTVNKSSPVLITVGGSTSWSHISAGDSYSSAIDSAGKLFTWGLNLAFQLGDSSSVNKSSPTQIAIGTSWKTVSSGFNHSTAIDSVGNLYVWGNFNAAFAPIPTTIYSWSQISAGNNITSGITSDNKLYVWGLNNIGQLGQANLINRSSPVQLSTGSDSFTQVSSKYYHVMFIDSLGKLFGVGDNLNGQLGDNTNVRKSSPVQVGNSSWTLVSTSQFNTYAINSSNQLYSWGNNNWQQLGKGINNNIGSWSQISASASFYVAIRTDGSLWTWGRNAEGQLGLGDTIARSSPTLLSSSSWIFCYAAGIDRSFAIDSSNRLYGWGSNGSGSLGISSVINQSSPVQIAGSWTKVASGFTHTVGIKSDNTVWAWGFNNVGQLGTNNLIAQSSPVQVALPYGVLASDVKIGNSNTLVLTTTNLIYTWGNTNNFGLGLGDTIARSSPTQLGSSLWTAIGAGANNGYGIDYNGRLFSWGTGAGGALGDGTIISKSSPVQVATTPNSFISVIGYNDQNYSAGAMALKFDGTAWNWGPIAADGVGRSTPTQVGLNTTYTKLSNSMGALVLLTSSEDVYQWGTVFVQEAGFVGTSSPVLLGYDPRYPAISDLSSPAIVGSSTWSKIDGGTSFALAIDNTGKLYAWGANSVNQVGDSTTVNRNSPILLDSGSWLAISAGFDHSLAIRSDNTLWTWGNGPSIGLVTEPQSWLYISAGNNHSLGIRDNGSLWAWGLNSAGQLGLFNTINRSSPVQVMSGSFASAYSSSSFSMVIDSIGRLFTWGLNSSGQLGNQSTTNKSYPIQITTKSWSQITGGVDHTLGIDNLGKLYGWGQYTTGQTGVYDEVYSWSQIASGLGLRTDNTLWAWGSLTGDGTTIVRSSPVQIGANDWFSITSHFLTTNAKGAIKTNGTLWMWGSNNQGQLGLNDTIDRSSPVQVPGSWSQISTQLLHTAALNADNIIYSWGNNASGELGDGTNISKSSPVLLASPFDTTSWTGVSVGWSFTAALRTDNIIYTWGAGSSGRLGTGLTTDRSNPVTLGGAFATSSFVSVSAGALHAASIRSNGSLVTWGNNSTGQLGDNTAINKSTPVVIGTSSWTAVTAGRINNVGITTAGSLWFWGSDLGTGDSGLNATINRSVPTQIGALTNWSKPMVVSAIDNTGKAFVWGDANSYLLDTEVAASSPVQVGGFVWPPTKYYAPQQVGSLSWLSVSAGTSYAVGIANNNLLYGWGINNAGQMADRTTIAKSSPVQLSEYSWNSVAAGIDHVLAIRNDTTLWTWGNSAAISLLVQPQSWSQISSGASHTLAIRSDGALFAWGIGTSGQLGDGTVISKSSPTVVGTSSWSSVSAGTNFSLATDSNGRLFGWGLNTSYQLGDTTIASKSSPVLIDAGSWTNISAGDTHAFAITSDNKLYGWGQNSVGQVTAMNISTSPWATISVGERVVLGTHSDGTLYAWGSNTTLGLGVGSINRSSPVSVTSGSWTSVATQNGFSLAIRSDGLLFGWGNNTGGQLGLNDTINRSSPIQIGSDSWTKVAVTGSSAAAIRNDGTLWTWGLNNAGQVGDGTTINKSNPVQIGTSSWSLIDGGAGWVIGLTIDGIINTWGNNVNGVLGDGTTINKSAPTLLGGGYSTSSFTQVTAGSGHILATLTNNLLFAWGLNDIGQLGDNTIISKSTPVQVANITNTNYSWTFIFGGNRSSGGLYNNTLYMWGLNASGELGDGTTINKSTPVIINNTYSWLTAAGEKTLTNVGGATIAIRNDGIAFVWGNNSNGQLGNGTTINRSSPIILGATLISAPVQVGASSWSQISAGTSFSVGINTTGLLYAWGQNNLSQLGNASTNNVESGMVQVTTGSWTNIAAGTNHTLAIKSDNTLWAWGNSLAVILSNVTPVSWSQIASDGTSSHVAAIKSDGSLWTWGLNTNGQLGDNTTLNKSSPTQIGTDSWTSVAVDLSNTMAIRLGGNMFVWGGNASGQLGDGSTISKSSPTQLDSNSWSQVAVNNSHAAAIRNNLLFVWGNNVNGQIGDGTTISKSSPVQITGSWNSVGAGSQYTLAINSSNLLFSWGNNAAFQLGDNTTLNKSSPIQIAAGISFTSVSAGPTHAAAIDSNYKLWTWGQQTSVGIDVNSWVQVTYAPNTSNGMAIRSDGRLFGWGLNTSGQLGLGDTIFRSSPVLVGSNSWTYVSAGGSYSLGIASDGSLFAWGVNTNGVLGIGLTTNRSSPVAVASGTSFTIISAGPTHALAVDTLAKLYAWGQNNTGQLGNGTTINRSAPVQIGTSSWSQVSAGTSHTIGLDVLGKLYTWGVNTNGVLGIGLTTNRSNPVQVGTSSWTKVSAGATHQLAIRTDGGLFAWGLNSSGELGNATTINRSSPVQIGTSSWSLVSAGASSSIALDINNVLYAWGLGTSGQLGTGTIINRSSPVQVLAGSQWSYIATGFNNTFAISSANATNNKLFVWGNNAGVMLGLGDTINRSSPTLLFSTTGTVIPTKILDYQSFNQVTAGISYTIAKRANDNTLMGWGINTVGNLGDNTLTQSSRSNPVIVGQNNQIDNSNNNLSATSLTGAPKLVDFSPFANQPYDTVTNGGSMQFNGVLDSINYASSIANLDGFNDASIEVWAYFNTLPLVYLFSQTDSASNFSFRTSPTNTNEISYTFGSTTTRGATPITTNVWYHLLLTFSAGDVRFFVNGVLRDYAAGLTTSASFGDFRFGNFSTAYYNGYMSNFRMCKGSIPTNYQTASTTIGTTIFTPSTTPLTTTSQGATEEHVSLLCFQGFPTAYDTIGALGQSTGFRKSTGELYMTGLGTSGQQGDGTAVSKSNPVQLGSVFTGLNTGFKVPVQVTDGAWNDVRAGASFSVALRNDFNVYTWGLGTSGQLGSLLAISRSSPTLIASALNQDFVDSSSSPLTIIIAAGQPYITESSPYASGIYDTSVYGISAYFDGSAALTVQPNSSMQIGTGDFTLECWCYPTSSSATSTIVGFGNYDFENRFGIGTLSGSIRMVTSVAGSTSNTSFGSISAPNNQWYHVAITRQGTTISSYANGNRLGTATNTRDYTTAFGIRIGSGDATSTSYNPTSFTAGYISNVRLVVGTALYTGTTYTVPTSVLTDVSGTALLALTYTSTNIVAYDKISAGSAHAYAIGDNALYGWGLNNNGQLGIGDIITRSNPVQLGAEQMINTYTNSPVQVTPGTSGYSQVFAGQSFSVVKKIDDSIFVWGLNTSGQLGVNTATSRSSPTQLGIPFSILDISTNNFTISRVGTRYSTSVVPISGAVSGLFNGVSEYIRAAYSSVFDFGTDNLTLETWVYPLTNTGSQSIIGQLQNNNLAAFGVALAYNSGAFSFVASPIVGSYFLNISSSAQPANAWYHVAGTRNGNVWTLWVNGVQAATSTVSGTVTQDATFGGIDLGSGYGNGNRVNFFNGYISNARVVKGVAVYTGAFTPPTSVLTATQSAGTNISAITGTQTALLTYTTFAQTISEPSVTFTDISVGYSHVEFIAVDDRLYATGLGSSGQLGFGNLINRSAPTIVGDGQVINTGTLSPIQVSFGLPNSWVAVSAGQSYSMAKDSTGSLYVWGLGSSGQLDNGSTINRSSPQIVGSTLISILDVSGQNNTISRVGTNFSTTIVPTAGAVSGYFAGSPNYIRCDNALSIFTTNTDVFTIEGYVYPVDTPAGPIAGVYFLGINTTAAGANTLVVGPKDWARNGGTGTALTSVFPDNTWTHFAITYDGTTFRLFNNGAVIFSSGTGLTDALSLNVLLFGTEADGADGTVLGNYFKGYLSSIRITKQALYTGTFTPPTDILTNSTVGTSGANVAPNLTGTVSLLTYTSLAASIVGGSPSYFANIAAGSTHAVATLSDDTLYVWGLGTNGQLGDNTVISKSSPVLIGNQFNTNTISPILAASASWSVTSAGTSHSLAIKNDGTLWAWGLNTSGQLGQSDVVNRSSIVQIGSGFSSTFTDTSENAFAITSNGSAFMTVINPFNTQVNVNLYGGSAYFGGTGSWIEIDNKPELNLGTNDFTIELWIYASALPNFQGLVGDKLYGSTGGWTLYLNFGEVALWRTGSEIAKGGTINLNQWHYIAWTRSSNVHRAFVDGILVATGTDSTNFIDDSILVGKNNTNYYYNGYISNLRIVTGSALYTANFTPPSTVLTAVSGTQLLTASYLDAVFVYQSISAGNSNSMAIKGDNTLFAWGLATAGALGTGNAINRSAPLQVGTSSWSQVSTGLSTTLGIDSTSNLYGWGNTATGQLGQSVTTPNRSNPTIVQGVNYETKSPTQVPGFWSDANAGLSHTAGVSLNGLYIWGLNSSGQLGLGDTVNRSSPVIVGTALTITDGSVNNFTVSSNGGITVQSSLIPFANTSAIYFNGSNSSLSLPSNSAWALGATGTIEFYVYRTGAVTTGRIMANFNNPVSIDIYILTNGRVGLHGGAAGFPSTDNSIALNIWTHVAVVYNSGNLSVYFDGVNQSMTGTLTGYNLTNSSILYIGVFSDGETTPFNGYISNLRIIKGVAQYTTNFTPPTTPLTAVSGTQLLIATNVLTTGYLKGIAGSATTYGIRSDGDLYAWGLGTSGQIGGYQQAINRSVPNQIGNNYININASTPVQIAAGSWSAVSAGNSISGAIRSDGKLFVWGSLAANGQMGDGTTIAKSSPVQIGNSSWTQVSVDSHIIATTTEAYGYTWGINASGQLGDNTTINRSSPVLVGSLFSAVLDASSYNNTITKVGTLYSTTVVPIAGSVSGRWTDTSNEGLTLAASSLWALGTTGTIEFWLNPSDYTNFERIIAQNNTSDGINILIHSTGQLSFIAPVGEVYTVNSLNLNTWYHIAFVVNSGTLTVYFNGISQPLTRLGSPVTVTGVNFTDSTTPLTVGNLGGGSTYVMNGYLSNIRIVKGIAVYTGNFTTPTSILTSTQSADTNISAITGTETVLLTYTTQAATIVGGVPTYFNSVAAGLSFTVATRTDGSLFAWGLGTSGQIGNSTAINRSSPVQIGTSSWTTVAAGGGHAAAIRNDGAMFNWGVGSSGQLGQAYSIVSRSSPVQIGQDYPLSNVYAPTKIDGELLSNSWIAVSAGFSYTSAIKSNNSLWTWGLNSAGQLGNNTAINRSSPTQVTGTYTDITSGNATTFGLSKDYPTGQ